LLVAPETIKVAAEELPHNLRRLLLVRDAAAAVVAAADAVADLLPCLQVCLIIQTAMLLQ
jgi:hypothetical protein